MSFIFVLFMLHLLTVCALYVCLCDYVNMCMYLVLLCIFGKKLLRACVYCLQKPNSNKVFLSYLILSYSALTHRRSWHGLCSNFLFTNLFSIKFLYFFIISSLFPYFNLFVSIFIQSYVNIKLHVSTLYRILIIHLLVYQQTLCFSVKSIEITITRV